MGRLTTGTWLRVREFGRQPLTLAALLLLPAAVIETYGLAVESFPRLPGLGTDPATAGRVTGAVFAVAFLAGLVGLFQVISARRGDERAAVAGFPRWAMLTTRLAVLVMIAVTGAVVAVATLTVRIDVARPELAVAGLVLAALVYGLIGVLVGTLVPKELEGSILLVFLADIDNALASGLFPLDTSVSVPGPGTVRITDLVPLYHPHELVSGAVLDGTVRMAHLVPTVVWIVGLTTAVFLAYGHVTGRTVPTGLQS